MWFFLLACTGPEPKTEPVDADGDGYFTPESEGVAGEDADCDDGNAAVHPDATEVCDGVDNNCDGAVDDADDALDESTATAVYTDADGDTWGVGEPTYTCQPDGATRAGDCDDARADIHPDATEVCDPDDTDEDCDGNADNADTSADASTRTAYYADADGDGYGSGGAASACDPPAGSAAEGADCDDANPAIHPGQAEVCDERNTDEDCDGLADDADASVDTSTGTQVWDDEDNDGYGAGEGRMVCDPTGAEATVDGDCDDEDDGRSPDADEVCDDRNVDEDCDGASDDDDDSTDRSTMLDEYADVDADGYAGTLVGQACEVAAGYRSAEDCDDARDDVHPGGTEVCDALDADEDCDGLADDADPGVDLSGGVTWYADADGDGFASDTGTPECDAEVDDLPQGTDCDDTNAGVNPDAAEVCDARNVDEDCNGVTDDDDAGVDTSTMSDVYGDADGDGSVGTVIGQACDVPGAADEADDCDDTNPDISPAATEVCDDADVDEDCDGLSDDDDPSVDTTGATVWYEDADGDGYASSTGAAECDAEETDTVQGEDCDDTDASVSPLDNDGDGVSGCDGDCDDTDATLTDRCEYTRMIGDLRLAGLGCEFDLQGTLADGRYCPDCDFSFDTTGVQVRGSCISSFYGTLGYREADQELSFLFYNYSELGPFDATLTSGSSYDTLEFSSYSTFGYLYYGTLFLY